jgi:hypothetical protein
VRPTERPAAAQSDIDAQPLLATFSRREAHGIDELIGQISQIAQPSRGIVERQRIHWLNLEATVAACLHRGDLAFQLRLAHSRTEPPPAHHRACVIGRRLKARANLFHTRRWRARLRAAEQRPQQEHFQRQRCLRGCLNLDHPLARRRLALSSLCGHPILYNSKASMRRTWR